jgi:LPXTG-motif cell wall-anchored protein
MNNKFIKMLFSGILSLVLVFSTFTAVFAAGGGGGGGTGTGQTDPVTLVSAYLTTISGNVSSTEGVAIDGNSNVDANPIIKLVFNKNMVWNSESKGITLTNWNGDLVDIDAIKLAPTDEKQNIFVSPKAPLKSGKTYILKIDKTIKANNGNTLADKVTITFTVAGIDEDLVSAQQVDNLITALPEISALTLADKTAVGNARKAYRGLTVDQQKFVTNVDKLTELEKKIEALELAQTEADQAAAQQVDDLITALSEVSALTLADKTAVGNARKAYSGLTVDQQKFVTNVVKLTELEKKIEALELAQTEADQAAAEKVDNLITALPEVSALTLADKASVAEARKAYDGLTKTQKELVKNQEKLVGLESKLAELENKPTDQKTPESEHKSNPDTIVTDQNPTGHVNDTAKNDNKKLPKTGDSSNVWASLFGSILLALGLVMLTIKRRGKIVKSSI